MGCSDVKATRVLHYTEDARSEQHDGEQNLKAIRLSEKGCRDS